MTSPALPSLFISHGAPTLLLEDIPARRFLADAAQLVARPRAILVVSAHWEASEAKVLSAAQPAMIYDFFGFPDALYRMRYPAPGATALAVEVRDLLAAAGFPAVLDDTHGYDHGSWVPLSLMFPAADIPVTQLAINPQQTPVYHWRLGRALSSLRDHGVLVIGSGAITHNLGDFRQQRRSGQLSGAEYAQQFADWFDAALQARQLDRVLGYREFAPDARRAHPTEEHLLPLFVALGAAGIAWQARRVHHSLMYDVLAMDAYLFDSVQPAG